MARLRKRIFLMIVAGDLTAGTQDYIEQFITEDFFKYRNWIVTAKGRYVQFIDDGESDTTECLRTCKENQECGQVCFNRYTNTLCTYDIRSCTSNCSLLAVDRHIQCGNSMVFVKEKYFEIFWESNAKVSKIY